MRSFILATFLISCAWTGSAQNKQTKAATIQWLQQHVTQERPAAGVKPTSHNATKLCVLKEARNTEIKDKEFTSKVVSYTSWKQDELTVQNDIFENNKLKETYTYHIPLSAIVSARLSNCQKNRYGIVDAYEYRPVFIQVKKNSTRIEHISYDKNGNAIGTAQSRMNKSDVDWDSVIPLVIGKQRETNLEDDAEAAFRRLAELNDKGVATK